LGIPGSKDIFLISHRSLGKADWTITFKSCTYER
jgi:hypothetical protein